MDFSSQPVCAAEVANRAAEELVVGLVAARTVAAKRPVPEATAIAHDPQEARAMTEATVTKVVIVVAAAAAAAEFAHARQH